ncbi:MAG TPA: glutamate--cysteine ligase [Turneriella sp.]|nr:glutamate--cysteine ligase [Turneriella sp.]
MNILLQNKIVARYAQIDEWLRSLEKDVPIFMSADIRDAGFKIASIDANLYPAGFNNLDASFHPLAARHLKDALAHYNIPAGSRLLLISEEHTRNSFYLENIRALSGLLAAAGYSVEVATQFAIADESYVDNALELRTASGNTVRLYDPAYASARLADYSALIMNHDSSAGTADWIKNATIPVLPAWQAGWHSRSKARHFAHYRTLMNELAAIVGVDPWFFAPLDAHITGIDINSDADRAKVSEQAAGLLKQIHAKYDEYQIQEKPFVFLKSDHGTYGMAMLSFDSAGEILEINRKEKNKLFKGKSSVVVKDYLLQEGVPTIVREADHFSETVVMLANNQFIGCFARANEQKDGRTSLNSTGMYFKPHTLAATDNDATRVAAIITRVAGIALQREICELVAHGAPGTAEPLPCP